MLEAVAIAFEVPFEEWAKSNFRLSRRRSDKWQQQLSSSQTTMTATAAEVDTKKQENCDLRARACKDGGALDQALLRRQVVVGGQVRRAGAG